jgi:hypothetical protein
VKPPHQHVGGGLAGHQVNVTDVGGHQHRHWNGRHGEVYVRVD